MNRINFGILVLAIVASVCISWISAQKTVKNSFQQQYGGNQQSAYGGYQSQPVQGPRKVQQSSSSSYSSSSAKQTNTVARRPTMAYQQQEQSYESSQQVDSAEADSEPASYGSVNGQPGVDFPAYTRVPKTSFSCDGLPYDYGMYADEETGCQAYHVCYNGRKDSFLCGVGTVFNQRILHCDYWYSVDCGKSSQYYSSNAYMGSSQPEPGPAQASGSSQQNTYKTQTSPVNRPSSAGSQRVQSSYREQQQQQVQQQQESY